MVDFNSAIDLHVTKSFADGGMCNLIRFLDQLDLRINNADAVLEKRRQETAGQVTIFVDCGASNLPGWINAGVYLLARDVINRIPPDRAVSLEREVFPKLLNGTLRASQTGGDFLDIGTPESYAAAEAFFAAVPEPSTAQA